MKHIIFSTLALTLAACGGGGSGSDNQTDETSVSSPEINAGHLKMIGADYALARSIEGAGVTIAVLDSGVNALHDEFAGKTLNQNSASFESAAAHYTLDEIMDMGLSGLDLYQPVQTGEQVDVFGHGTHVASLIWGENVGVAPEADLMMMDVYPSTAPDSLAAKGLLAELANMEVDFINASLTGVDYYESSEFVDEKPLFEALDTQDMGFVVAAGNFGLDMTETFITNPVDCEQLSESQRNESLTCTFVFDATSTVLVAKDGDLADNFIWVGAIDDRRQPAVFQLADGTVTGTNVPGNDSDIQSRWISAPGANIEGAFFDNNSDYLQVSGTSQAAPLVTGAAALVKGQYPTLSNAAALQILLDSADDSFEGYDPSVHGQGILDIEAALKIDPSVYEAL